jgi:SNF2 family DNA or RNA helicase
MKTTSTGINLAFCNTIIFAELGWNVAHFIQAEKRIHRIGQQRQCNVYYVSAKMTTDVLLVQEFMRKSKLIEDITGIDENFCNIEVNHVDLQSSQSQYSWHTSDLEDP